MEVFTAIEKRHSYRGIFLKQQIPDDHLKKIVNAGIMAPSGKNAQTTEFVIINQPELILRVAEITGHAFIRTAQAIIVCIIEKNIPVYHGHSFEIEDCAAATENMLLAVTALGYATVWIDGVLRLEQRAGMIGKLIKLSPRKEVRIILPLGVPAGQQEQKAKKPFAQRAWFNQYPAGSGGK